MEGSESEAVFESLNLNPQNLVNEILNTVENLLDDAFVFYRQEASTLLNDDGTDRSESLSQGIDHIRGIIQSNVGRRLGMWQEYCLRHCFAVPEGFSLPKRESPDESLASQDMLCNPDLDAKLNSLRERLTVVSKESAELNHELQALERQSACNDGCVAIAKEALQLYEQNSSHDMLQEMVRDAALLRTKIEKLRRRKVAGTDSIRTMMMCNAESDLPKLNNGVSDANLDDLQEFLANLNKL